MIRTVLQYWSVGLIAGCGYGWHTGAMPWQMTLLCAASALVAYVEATHAEPGAV